eukprot:1146309-Pelagomonas_calceolata.AAC.1
MLGVPKHLKHERFCQGKLVQNWKLSNHSVSPHPEYENLFSILSRPAKFKSLGVLGVPPGGQ